MKLDTLSLADLGGSPWDLAIPVASVPLPTRADVVVIGAGITGLSAAIALAERGIAVVVADRSFGGGATCRSGGIVLGETLVGPSPEFDRCDLTLRHWIERSQIPCDAVWSGCLELARHATVNARDTGWVDGAPLKIVGEVPGGMLHPGKFLIGLLHEATRHGVVLCNHLEIHGIDPDGDEVIVRGSSDIRARHVVMAVDALSWSRGFDPWLERTMTVALQTTAVDGLAKAIDLSAPFYTNDFPLLWGRRLPDGSLLFGRELIAWRATDKALSYQSQFEAARDRLTARVRALHPSLRHVGIQRVWAGPTARTPTGIPVLVQDPEIEKVVWAGGYGGHGLAQAFTLGRAGADFVMHPPRERAASAVSPLSPASPVNNIESVRTVRTSARRG